MQPAYVVDRSFTRNIQRDTNSCLVYFLIVWGGGGGRTAILEGGEAGGGERLDAQRIIRAAEMGWGWGLLRLICFFNSALSYECGHIGLVVRVCCCECDGDAI